MADLGGTSFEIQPIGEIITPYKEKFAIPHQAQAVKEVEGYIRLFSKYADENAVRGLEGFSHLWLIWLFSKVEEGYFSPTVRPPRLGGNKRVGVFASRSPFRPNRLGLSLVRLKEIKKVGSKARLIIGGVDMLSGTPLIDIKPYVPYDLAQNPCFSWAEGEKAQRLSVEFEQEIMLNTDEETLEKIRLSLENDPRPAYDRRQGKAYGFLLDDMNIRFTAEGDGILVTKIEKA